MAARKKPDAKKPVAKKPVAKKPVAKRPVAKTRVAKTRVAKKPVADKRVAKKRVAKKPVAKKTKPAVQKRSAKTGSVTMPGKRSARTRVVRERSARTRVMQPATDDRVTPRVHETPVPDAAPYDGFRPSRVMTTRPRPDIRQVDPTEVSRDAPLHLQPWEVEIDDLTMLASVRAAEEKAVEEAHAKLVATPESARARVGEARAAGWSDDPRPAPRGLPDARVRLVHPNCRFIDGKAIREVSLSIHPASGRATLLIEGGPRLRSVSWRMREDEELPLQVARALDDPQRLARMENASAQELLAALEALDRNVVTDLRSLVNRNRERITARLRQYCLDFAAVQAAFGLAATVDAVWDRFGVRRGCALERLGLPDATRRAVASAFDAALDVA